VASGLGDFALELHDVEALTKSRLLSISILIAIFAGWFVLSVMTYQDGPLEAPASMSD
jgi:hypothetical protein